MNPRTPVRGTAWCGAGPQGSSFPGSAVFPKPLDPTHGPSAVDLKLFNGVMEGFEIVDSDFEGYNCSNYSSITCGDNFKKNV